MYIGLLSGGFPSELVFRTGSGRRGKMVNPHNNGRTLDEGIGVQLDVGWVFL
jgi:hypothetical protein